MVSLYRTPLLKCLYLLPQLALPETGVLELAFEGRDPLLLPSKFELFPLEGTFGRGRAVVYFGSANIFCGWRGVGLTR